MTGDPVIPLAQIMAEAIDAEAFKVGTETAEREMRRRSALAVAKVGLRIAQALGWRFIPPGEFHVLSEHQLDEMHARAKANMKEAGDLLERGE